MSLVNKLPSLFLTFGREPEARKSQGEVSWPACRQVKRPVTEHYSLLVQMGPNVFFTKVIMSGSKMNQTVFPTVWKASSLSKTWWGSQWTSATPSGQNYTPEATTICSFSLAPRKTTSESSSCVGITEQVHIHKEWVKQHSTKQARGHQNCQKNIWVSHEFAWLFLILFLELVWNNTSELAIIWISSRRSAQDNLVWCLNWPHSNMKSYFHKKLLSAGTIAP